MRKYDCIWLMLCLVWTGTSSCSDKKNSADKQEQGVSTVLPDAKNEVTTQILKRRDFHLLGDDLLDFTASTEELYRPRNTWVRTDLQQ